MNSTFPEGSRIIAGHTHGSGFPLHLQNKQIDCLFRGRRHKRSNMARVKPPLLPSV